MYGGVKKKSKPVYWPFNGHILSSVFVGFSKAFDTISHDILSHKLEVLGVRGPAFSLICSYLRMQMINFEGSLSHI